MDFQCLAEFAEHDQLELLARVGLGGRGCAPPDAAGLSDEPPCFFTFAK